jgi:dual-specificity kinase
VSYSEVQEVDSEGKLREVIVIDDTPPPPTISPATTYTNGFSASYQPPQYSAPIRTRARAAAEAQALSASTSSVAIIAPAPKKRKRDPVDDPRATVTKKTVIEAQQQQQTVATTKSWASGSGAATDEVRMSAIYRHQTLTWPIFRHPRVLYLAMTRRVITSLFQMI